MQTITRTEAKSQGLKRYFTGKPCKHGHLTFRGVASGGCCECERLRSLKRSKTPEGKAARTAWKQANLHRYSKYLADQRARRTPQQKAAHRLRERVRSSIIQQGGAKSFKTMGLIGCTVEELCAHLESLFCDGMTWDNMGDWEIDHILPCVSFDLTNESEQKVCFHYTNLQPLWMSDNRSKCASFRLG